MSEMVRIYLVHIRHATCLRGNPRDTPHDGIGLSCTFCHDMMCHNGRIRRTADESAHPTAEEYFQLEIDSG
jgi:hypothetical protein